MNVVEGWQNANDGFMVIGIPLDQILHATWAAVFAGCCGFVIVVNNCLWAVVTGKNV
jgi:hypothetical protein